jgi:hypothetical protein
MTPILLTVACVVCAAAIAAVPGPGANANRQADAAKIVSALALVPKAVTSYDKTAGERTAGERSANGRSPKSGHTRKPSGKTGQRVCVPAAVVPPAGLALAEPPGCAAITSTPTPIPHAGQTAAPAG